MDIQPLGENILLEVIKEEEKSKSGIIIPDSAKEKKPPMIAKVVAVGVEVLDLAVGQTVIFSDYGFDPITIEDKEYQIGPLEKVLAIIN